MKTFTIEDILKHAEDNPNVQRDNKRALELENKGHPLCDHCGGTGNELLFMYRECPKCAGTGIACIPRTEVVM